MRTLTFNQVIGARVLPEVTLPVKLSGDGMVEIGELGAIDSASVEFRLRRVFGYCPGGLKTRTVTKTRQVRKYSDTECIDMGIKSALSTYASHIHGKVIERDYWDDVIRHAVEVAGRNAQVMKTERYTTTERYWGCD